MKHLLALLAICITPWGGVSAPARADAPQSGTLEIALTKSAITVGEPLILKYRVSNPEDHRVHVAIDSDVAKWLKIRLNDASGHPIQGTQAITESAPRARDFASEGVPIAPKGYHEGFLILSPNFQPTQPGRYQLNLTARLTYTWDWHDITVDTSENSEVEQNYSLSLIVSARDSQQLLAVAESLRQTVLNNASINQYRLADKALFAMHDPVCLPVWRALATDANLDPWKAVDVMGQLQDVGSASACDILAEMQPVAPERWSQTGTTPLSVLEKMWRPATPEIKQHINRLLAQAGVPQVTEHTRLAGNMH